MGRKGKKMAFAPELLDQLLEDYHRPEDMLGPGGIFDQLKKALAERALGAELGHHLAQEAATPAAPHNHRNGSTPKTVQTDTSALRAGGAAGPGRHLRAAAGARSISGGCRASTRR